MQRSLLSGNAVPSSGVMSKTFIVRRLSLLCLTISLIYLLYISAAASTLPNTFASPGHSDVPGAANDITRTNLPILEQTKSSIPVPGAETGALYSAEKTEGRQPNNSTATIQAASRRKPEPPFRKPQKNANTPPVEEIFRIAANAKTAADLPRLPAWISSPSTHLPTPLLIGFTRNWPMLQQTVLSYITAGWPADQIYVVENTGTMMANPRAQLSMQNPFFLDHFRLKTLFGVHVITTPTLLTFAQLQNFFLHFAMQNDWLYYFWSHMDIVAVSDESQTPFESLYTRAVKVLENATSTPTSKWAAFHFAYDHFTLVNRSAYELIGGFDPMISFYLGDCDFHERLKMAGYTIETAEVGHIFDVGMTLPDMSLLYHTDDERSLELCFNDANESRLEYGLNDCRYEMLIQLLKMMEFNKLNHDGGRNFWQGSQRGGKGEPYYADPEGFEWAIRQTIEHGKSVYREKWGTDRCDLVDKHLRPEDAWNVFHEWDYQPPVDDEDSTETGTTITESQASSSSLLKPR